jgi:hypothetical protein
MAQDTRLASHQQGSQIRGTPSLGCIVGVRRCSLRPRSRNGARSFTPSITTMAFGFSFGGSRSLMACVHAGASRRASSRTRLKSGLILRTTPICGVSANTNSSPYASHSPNESPMTSTVSAGGVSTLRAAGGLIDSYVSGCGRRLNGLYGSYELFGRTERFQPPSPAPIPLVRPRHQAGLFFLFVRRLDSAAKSDCNIPMIKHVMGVLLVFIGWQAVGATYATLVDFQHYWLTGVYGVALWLALALIYWRWFQGSLWYVTVAILGAPALVGLVSLMR